MYMIRIDHSVYDRHPVTREPFTLVSAMRELYGCGSMYGAGGVAVLRADGTPVVIGAGSASAVTYAPTGRSIPRRRARHLTTPERLTILGCGETVYVFRADQREAADAQEMVLHVAYPADDVIRRRMTSAEWAEAKVKVTQLGAEIIDITANS